LLQIVVFEEKKCVPTVSGDIEIFNNHTSKLLYFSAFPLILSYDDDPGNPLIVTHHPPEDLILLRVPFFSLVWLGFFWFFILLLSSVILIRSGMFPIVTDTFWSAT
jgi:hypothetical protein